MKELRKDLSQLEASKYKDISNFRHWERLERKYSIRVKRLNVAIEELKQRITLLQQKLEGVREGQIAIDKTEYFKIIKGSFIGNQNRKKKDVIIISLWLKNRNSFGETSADHKTDEKWLHDLRSEVSVKKQEKINITIRSLKKILATQGRRKLFHGGWGGGLSKNVGHHG